MADITIPQLNAATSVSGTDVMVISQAWVTKKVEVDKLTEKVLSSSVNILHMNPTTVQTLANIGELAFNPDTQTLEVKCSADVTLSIGQENYIRGKNAEASTILNGTVVYVSGGIVANSLIKRAGNADGTAERVIGVATQDIAANNIGFITTSGIVNKLNTSSYAEGDLLWLGTNGAMANVKPDTSVDQICIGVVLMAHATEGSILVAVKDDWRDKLAEVRSDLNSLGQEIEINYIIGGFIDTTSESLIDGAVGILADIESVVTDATWKYAVVECKEGDIFTISGTSAGWSRLWTWLDSKKRIINCSNHELTVSNHVIIAPKNSKYLISNNFDLSNGKLIHGFSVSNTNYILKERDELLNSSDINLNFVVGGMDNGIPNTDQVAVHSAEFLKVNNQNVCIYSESFGVVLQLFDENKQYISLVMNAQQGLREFSLDSSVRYVKICLFHEASTPISETNPEVNNSKITIDSLNVYFSGLEKESIENITYPVLTKAYKASSVNDGKVIFQRDGEGVVDQIQLIGAFDTTSIPKNEFWVNYHQTILQITVDGEVSVRGTIYDLCGLSSNIITRDEYANGIFEGAIFQTPLFSKTGLYSGITLNFKIPYYKSIKIELLGTSGLMWGMVKSLTNVDFEIGGVKIPYGAKFHGITVSQSCVKGDLIVLMDTTKYGMLLGVNVAGTSNMFDWVEGCIRALKYGLTTQDKCTMLSSGLEDYLGGAFGFNIGEKQFENWGCTLNKMTLAENYRLCGYRNHINDKVLFDRGGFKVAARWGDQNASNWDLSTTANFGGQTGNPGVGNFYATAFYYDWE